MSADHYVYGLFRPDTGLIFYIGMGRGRRAWMHVPKRMHGRSFKDNVVCHYIDTLGYTEIPTALIRDGLTREEACDLERALILAIGRDPHGPLTNTTAGGDWGLHDPSPAVREKIASSLRAKFTTDEQRAARGEEMKRRLADPEVRERMAAAKRGKPGNKRGKLATDETKARQREAALRRASPTCPKGHDGPFRMHKRGHRVCISCEREYAASHPRPSGWERQRQSSVEE